jgi:hypothetical protein
LFGFEDIGAPNHFVEGAEAEGSHDFPQVLGDEPHEVDGVGGISGIGGAEFGVLGGDTSGAGIQMADAHHDTAEGVFMIRVILFLGRSNKSRREK